MRLRLRYIGDNSFDIQRRESLLQVAKLFSVRWTVLCFKLLIQANPLANQKIALISWILSSICKGAVAYCMDATSPNCCAAHDCGFLKRFCQSLELWTVLHSEFWLAGPCWKIKYSMSSAPSQNTESPSSCAAHECVFFEDIFANVWKCGQCCTLNSV